jgi:hypothetical protein
MEKARVGRRGLFLSPHLQAMDFFICCPRILPQFGETANHKKARGTLRPRAEPDPFQEGGDGKDHNADSRFCIHEEI